MIDARNDFESKGKINKLKIERITDALKHRRNIPLFAKLIDIVALDDNSWIPSQYVDTTPPKPLVDIVALNAEVRDKDARYRRAIKMWDEMIVFMEHGMCDTKRPTFINNQAEYERRIIGSK